MIENKKIKDKIRFRREKEKEERKVSQYYEMGGGIKVRVGDEVLEKPVQKLAGLKSFFVPLLSIPISSIIN